MRELTAIEIAELVKGGQVKATEVLDDCLSRIGTLDPALNAFVHLDLDGAHQAAEQVDAIVASGSDPGALAGVPFGIKDLYDCSGMPTSHGSLMYKGRPAAESDSPDVARLRAAGAVPVGKTASPEFGAVALTDTKAWGVTRNPWDIRKTPGGSSGGSAAAVASGMVPISTASDGGGSTRIPAAFCGLVGFKPSFGRIPITGNQPSATTVMGILATTVAEAARHLDLTAGPDDRDRQSLPPPTVRYENAIESFDVAGLRACWSTDLGYAVVDPEVAALAEAAAHDLIAAARLTEASRPVAFDNLTKLWGTNGVLDLYLDLEPGMWPERSEEFTDYVGRSLDKCDAFTPARIARAWQRRQQLDDQLAELFSDIDVLLTPTTAVPAYGAEWPMPFSINGEPVHPSMNVPFTMLANLGWHPAMSVPAGLTAEGLPVGLQIQCRRHADETVLRLARIFEQARPWPRHAKLAAT